MSVVKLTKVILHPLSAIHKEVVVRVIERRPIIIVYVLLWGVVVDEEVVRNVAPLHDHVRLARTDCRLVSAGKNCPQK